jgi:nicotinate-nucleotide adenylyltransferase
VSAPAGAHIGILGGTFNPPHRGHVALAQHAFAQLRLTQMLLMPAGTPPHKQGEADPGAEHRLAMCRLAILGSEGLSVSALEVERGGPSYTVDTLRDIKASTPDAKLTFVVGADTARTLPAWREPAQLLGLAEIAVAARTGTDQQELRAALGSLEPDIAVTFLQMPSVDVSSSLVRTRVARGEPVAELVGAPVASYIAEHGLYTGRTSDGAAQARVPSC